MALGEGAAPRVLTGQPNAAPLQDERAEREQLGGRPVDVAVARHRHPPVDLRLEPGVDGEAVRRVGVRLGDPLDDLDVRRRRDGLRRSQLLDLRRRRGASGGVAGLDEHLLQLGLEVLERGLGVFEGDVATADERLGVQLPDAALRVDDVVHQRLRERRVVGLVVAASPVADHVDDDVLLELAPVVDGQLRDAHARLWVVGVHVEDRCGDHPGDVGAVQARSGLRRRGREADLVVDDDMHGSAGAVAAQLRDVQRLGDDTLAGERGVAVHENRQHAESGLALVQDVLLGTHDAFEYGVDRFEVGRIRGERHGDRVAARRVEPPPSAEVVFDVAGALRGARVDVALELVEDLRVGLADDVGQYVEPAAMRHADDRLVQALVGGLRQHGVEQRDDGLGAFQAESLLADVLGLQERLECLGDVEATQNMQLCSPVRRVALELDA